jgi:hypothetical protein
MHDEISDQVLEVFQWENCSQILKRLSTRMHDAHQHTLAARCPLIYVLFTPGRAFDVRWALKSQPRRVPDLDSAFHPDYVVTS